MGDFYIYALLFKPNGENVPIGYNDERGKRQKIYLQDALKLLGVDVLKENREFQSLGGDYRNYPKMCHILKRWIELYWPQLEANSAHFFSVAI